MSDFWDEEKSYFKFFMQNQVIFRPIIISALIVAILYKVKKKIQKIIVISKLQFFSAKLNMRFLKIIIFFWHRWWQILGARIGAKMVIFG